MNVDFRIKKNASMNEQPPFANRLVRKCILPLLVLVYMRPQAHFGSCTKFEKYMFTLFEPVTKCVPPNFAHATTNAVVIFA